MAIKIGDTAPRRLELGSGAPVDGKPGAVDFSQTFERHFNEQGQSQYERYVQELKEKIDRQAERLGVKMDLAEFERFRELIGQLINEVVSNAYAFRKENVVSARGRRKVYATVATINEKLDSMAAGILGDNFDSIDMLSQIDDIRGLILDMLL